MALPLMPKATAVWLVDNTTLAFRQIAEFCGLHPLEVQGVADGEIAQNIVGLDPVVNGQLTAEEIRRCEEDDKADLQLRESITTPSRTTKGARYTPVSKRQDRPSAIAWLLRNHPELSDAQMQRLLGTTKDTINKIRNRTRWNIQQLKPTDPVSLGLCTQPELAAAVTAASERRSKTAGAEEPSPTEPNSPDPMNRMSENAAGLAAAFNKGRDEEAAEAAKSEKEPTVDSVFGQS